MWIAVLSFLSASDRETFQLLVSFYLSQLSQTTSTAIGGSAHFLRARVP